MNDAKEKQSEAGCPLVSVIITTYRREVSYVRESLESALDQTYPNIEVIVVDDNGGDDKHSAAIRRLCDEYEGVACVSNDINMGAQYSRNAGIMASSGKYIAFLDDDDLWAPEKTEVQMALFADPEVGMVYCDGYSFVDGDKENLEVFREASLFDQPISHELELFNDYIGSTSQAIVRRECFSAVGLFDPDMPARQDYEMWLRISRRYKIVGSPQKLLYYRIHLGERISTNWEKCHESYELILEKYGRSYNRNKYAKAKLVLRLFATAKNMGRSSDAMRYFFKAFFASPRCVLDVIRRHLKQESFSKYYSKEKLSSVLRCDLAGSSPNA